MVLVGLKYIGFLQPINLIALYGYSSKFIRTENQNVYYNVFLKNLIHTISIFWYLTGLIWVFSRLCSIHVQILGIKASAWPNLERGGAMEKKKFPEYRLWKSNKGTHYQNYLNRKKHIERDLIRDVRSEKAKIIKKKNT